MLLSTSLGSDDSFEAARAIRRGLDLLVFFLSPSYDAAFLDRAREVGCDGFLVRPFTDVALDIALWMALDRHAERQSLRQDLEELKEKLEARKLIKAPRRS